MRATRSSVPARMWEGVSPVPARMWARVSPVPAQMWAVVNAVLWASAQCAQCPLAVARVRRRREVGHPCARGSDQRNATLVVGVAEAGVHLDSVFVAGQLIQEV